VNSGIGSVRQREQNNKGERTMIEYTISDYIADLEVQEDEALLEPCKVDLALQRRKLRKLMPSCVDFEMVGEYSSEPSVSYKP